MSPTTEGLIPPGESAVADAPASAALPRLRQMLDARNVWTLVHSAKALCQIGGEAEASIVVQTLLRAGRTSHDLEPRSGCSSSLGGNVC